MTHSELVCAVSRAAGVDPATGAQVISALTNHVQQEVAQGRKVQLNGLFVAEQVQRAERTGRNPRTGEPIVIPSHPSVRLTASAVLKRAACGR